SAKIGGHARDEGCLEAIGLDRTSRRRRPLHVKFRVVRALIRACEEDGRTISSVVRSWHELRDVSERGRRRLILFHLDDGQGDTLRSPVLKTCPLSGVNIVIVLYREGQEFSDRDQAVSVGIDLRTTRVGCAKSLKKSVDGGCLVACARREN